jgi:hypothetical protein
MALTYEEYQSRFPGSFHHYGNASHGFYDILVWLQKNKPLSRPNIVMPVFIPAKLYRFVLAAGYQPVFYDVTPDCRFNPAEVAGLIDDQTQAVLAIHYFGIPSPIRELKELTKKAGVFLIEDCAHTLNSRIDGVETGTIGDCAIFSIRKMLQLPSCGLLVLNNPGFCRKAFIPSGSKKVRSIFTAYYLLTSRIKYGYYKLTKGHDPLKVAWIPETGYIDFSDEQKVNVKSMSLLSRRYLKSVDLDLVAGKRRFNYQYLLNGISDFQYLQPVNPVIKDPGKTNGTASKFLLKDGFVPFSFPILTSSGTREILRSLLCKAGIGCGAGWPESPFYLEGFDNARELSIRMVELPVHQGINIYQLQRILSCLEQYENQLKIKTIPINEKNTKSAVII